MADYKIAETHLFTEKIEKRIYTKIYQKIVNYVYPQLRNNPYFGKNIKKMTAEFDKVYRYRIGDFRLFYTIDDTKKVVIILSIDNRKDAYKKK